MSLYQNNKDAPLETPPTSGSPAHPHDLLREKARLWQVALTDRKFALRLDEEDALAPLRARFHYPKNATLPHVDRDLVEPDEDCVYFSGNSLGLMPKAVSQKLQRETEKWAAMALYGHLTGAMPWALCDERLREGTARLVGAKVEEVAIMNSLTVNLHLAMISFYNPTQQRHKILLESNAFPSDHYCIESQITLRGFDPNESMLLVEPRSGENSIRTEDIVAVLEAQGSQIALVLLSGVQYYTGQLFNIQKITEAGHRMGCWVGFDLAHAVGNVPLCLHDWGVDFAVWCFYKYVNSGAGVVGGLFVHEDCSSTKRHRLTGWWSHDLSTRFLMNNKLELSPGAAGYRVSNPSMFHGAALEASLEVFAETSMSALSAKSRLLTGYLEMLLTHYFSPSTPGGGQRAHMTILTPSDPAQRGCQLSVEFSLPIGQVFERLTKYGVVCDKREPGVLRLAPVPLYNSFLDVYRFINILRKCLELDLAA